ncbi:MAG: sigma 54-interacting transcriptional regulator [Nitrospirota bacterium]
MKFHLKSNELTQLLQIIMGKSPRMLRVYREIKKIAKKDFPVFIRGEKGTHKEIIARAVHHNSPRLNGPFVTLTLSSLAGGILEAELFGRDTAAETDNIKEDIGKLARADGGTIFLNELAEMTMDLQEILFRYLITRKTDETGSDRASGVDVRVIGASSRNLKEVVSEGLFREDLYEIFASRQIRIPPLRERKDDILPMADYFLKEAAERFETGTKELSKDAKEFLISYNWPGNIRELEDILRKAVILSNGSIISKKNLIMDDIGSYSIRDFLEGKLKRYLKEMTRLGRCNLHNTVLSEVEKSLIALVLRETGNNQLKTARILGINRNTLRSKIKDYELRI